MTFLVGFKATWRSNAIETDRRAAAGRRRQVQPSIATALLPLCHRRMMDGLVGADGMIPHSTVWAAIAIGEPVILLLTLSPHHY